MKILVCIKQVLDSNTPVRVDRTSGMVIVEGPLKHWMNHADEFAVEETLLIKEAWPGTVVEALTVGPGRAAQVLERAIGMGADNGVHILVPEEDYLSPLTIASWIATCASDSGYDLILTGVMAEDDMEGQVGPLLAELLGFPCATSVIFETVNPAKGVIYVERECENGRRDTLEMDLPAVLAVQTGINQPRYPTLSNLLRAKKQKVFAIDSSTLPATDEREKIVRADYPRKSRAGVLLEGDRREKAIQLLHLLKREGLLQIEG